MRAQSLVKVVFLDWYGTLSLSRFFEHWSAEGHPRQASFARLQGWWLSGESRSFLDAWLTGARTTDHFVREMGVLLELPEGEIREELIEGFGSWTLLDNETPAQIAELRARGTRVVLATDNVDAGIRWGPAALGLSQSFDAILSSHDLGVCKGQPDERGRSRFFAPYLEAEGIGPGESVLIDDAAHIAEVVEATGIRFLHAPFGTGPGLHLSRLLQEAP